MRGGSGALPRARLVLAAGVIVGAGVGVGAQPQVHFNPGGGARGRLIVAILLVQPVAAGERGGGGGKGRW